MLGVGIYMSFRTALQFRNCLGHSGNGLNSATTQNI